MAAGFNRWESDPLFSAAEVVQDSADRMESLLRIVLHQQSLVNGDVLDPKLYHSIECHKRDLVTALETTKWQLEDFERALYVSPSSDKSHMRRDVSSRHSQFVRAIREQIAGVEQSLEDSPAKDITGNQNWVNLNKHDRDGLALFLSGGESMDNQVRYDVENGILRSFLDPNSNGDEIVELKTEELEGLEVNDAKNSEEKNKSRNMESHYPKQFSEQPPEVSDGDRNCEVWADSRELDLELGNSGEKFSSSDNRVKRFVGYLSSFSLPIVNKMNRSFTKKRKDGEVLDDYAANVEGRTLSSCHDMSQVEQRNYNWIPLGSSFRTCHGLHGGGLRDAMQLENWIGPLRRRMQRSQYLIRYNRLPVRSASAVLVTVIVFDHNIKNCSFSL